MRNDIVAARRMRGMQECWVEVLISIANRRPRVTPLITKSSVLRGPTQQPQHNK